MQRIRSLIAAVAVIGLCAQETGVAEEKKFEKISKKNRVGKRVDDFQIEDIRGVVQRLSGDEDRKAVVLAFIGTQCPLSNLYAPRLVELAQRYGPEGVRFLGINSNRQDTLLQVTDHARRYAIRFPVGAPKP